MAYCLVSFAAVVWARHATRSLPIGRNSKILIMIGQRTMRRNYEPLQLTCLRYLYRAVGTGEQRWKADGGHDRVAAAGKFQKHCRCKSLGDDMRHANLSTADQKSARTRSQHGKYTW